MKIALAIGMAAGFGCGNSGPPADAPISSDGKCGADLEFTGEIVDWDSSDTQFCGVFGATLTARGDTSRSDTTNPNGRFELCLARSGPTHLDLVPPTGASMCSAAGSYAFPGLVIANPQVIATATLFSARMIGMMRAGAMFDPAKAVVLVHSEGTSHPVTSSAAHDAAMAWDGAQWGTGDSGANVVFPNTDISGGTTTIGVASGSAIGTGSVPVAAGTFTYVTIVGQ